MGSNVSDGVVGETSQDSEAYQDLCRAGAEAGPRNRADRLERWLARSWMKRGFLAAFRCGNGRPADLARRNPAGLGGALDHRGADARIEGLVLATLRFMRPDGSMVFGPHGISDATKRAASDVGRPACRARFPDRARLVVPRF